MNKIKVSILIICFLLCIALFYHYGRRFWYPCFLQIRGKYTLEEVSKKYGNDAEGRLASHFKKVEVNYPPSAITLIALKEERVLELWAELDNSMIFIKSYPFTGFSGELGPKLKSGDRQIPEGIYKITWLNPNSSYHLSIKINYPNRFDLEKAKEDGRTNLGGDIFIHGKSVTIGCIPIGDPAIEELFTLVQKIGNENAQVIIAPYDLRTIDRIYPENTVAWLPEKYDNIRQALILFNHKVKQRSDD
ncbi:MAG: L,D-transpeptidase family protein [Planctomycetes bacterium]|nr:L,D-transpeptidase family protein [Planctomycetota bacterium]